MSASDEPTASPLAWGEDGVPRSQLFGDVYFSAADGLAETRAVFLEGCGLPEAWRGRRRFVVGELGFGTGLNIAALIELWRRTRPADARLHVFSVEAHPVTAEEAARALARWPELDEVAQGLTARWPGRARGVHRLELAQWGVLLDVAVMDVAAALDGWSGRADAWFLDGFSPAVNPDMWRDEILAKLAARSAPGARAATFTVAGQVRRGLAAAGFAVEKRPGFGRKRERLEARLPGETAYGAAPGKVAVIGGGIAGAAAARAVRALGGAAQVIDEAGLGAGGSGNPAALVTPRLDAGLGAPAELFARAFARAAQLYEQNPDAIVARGVLQLARGERDLERFARIAGSDLFEPGALQLLSATEAAARLGEPAQQGGLDQRSALVVEPRPYLAAWAGEAAAQAAAAVLPDEAGWRIIDAAGSVIARADAVIVAAAIGSQVLAPGLALQPIRGQLSWARTEASVSPVAWGGYAAPMRGGVMFGATHDRDDLRGDLREADHRRNLATLAAALPGLAARLEGLPLGGRAAVRTATGDRLPAAGPAAGAPPGLFVLTGFGSRGFSLAPLLAEHVAATALGAPSPLPMRLATLVDPGRFERRSLARARGQTAQG